MRGTPFPIVLCVAALGACRPVHTAPATTRRAVYLRAWLPGMTGSEAVRDGRGALFDERRVELVERAPDHWALVSGRLDDAFPLDDCRLDARFSQVDMPALDGCRYVTVAYVAGSLMFTCVPAGARPQDVRFFQSTPSGGAVLSLPRLRLGPGSSPGVFPLSPTGDALLSIVCLPDAPCPSDISGPALDLIACGDAGCLFYASWVRLGWDLP